MSLPTSALPPILPNCGTAKVKSVLSGDTVVLLGRGAEGKKATEVTFTFERVTAPWLVVIAFELRLSCVCGVVQCTTDDFIYTDHMMYAPTSHNSFQDGLKGKQQCG